MMSYDERDEHYVPPTAIPEEVVEFATAQMAETIREDQRRAAFVQGLRDLADFLTTHPTVPAPYSTTMNVFVNTKEEIAAIARLATWGKTYNENWFSLSKAFGPVQLDVNTERSTVCRRVVVGKQIVPAREAQEVDVVEWVCDEAVLA
jgi:hypothetical protein